MPDVRELQAEEFRRAAEAYEAFTQDVKVFIQLLSAREWASAEAIRDIAVSRLEAALDAMVRANRAGDAQLGR